MIKRLIVLLVLSVFSITTMAGEWAGKVKALYINNDGRVLVNIENGTAQPACGGGLWHLGFNLADNSAKEWVSMLLMSKASNTSIRVGYTDNPTGTCAVVYFYYFD